MFDQLVSLLQRQVAALDAVESRLRALELLLAADEQRFVSQAMAELEQATERLAALELGRALVLSSAGLDVDAPARELEARVDEDVAGLFHEVVERLRTATERVGDARTRAYAALAPGAEDLRQRLVATEAYAGV
ncbi:MAG TPA: hypothetical protein VK906_01980 [Egicoccus sp.]|nr:hypothetical protein [Egicoccus sp.]HSK21911.1 hypothetical protein [Egicoccus sp.]